MDINEYLSKMEVLQQALISFIDSESEMEENFQILLQIFEDHKIRDDRNELKLFFKLITKISNHFYRPRNFFEKIEKIILLFKKEIIEKFSQTEIFDLFKNNKRILLFLFNEKIISMNQTIADIMRSNKYRYANYPQYFAPEIRPFFTEEEKDPSHRGEKLFEQITKELPNDFDEKRKKGENDDFVCEMIRKDQIDEFIAFVNRTNLSLQSVAAKSIYETNSYLNNKVKYVTRYTFHPTLIEYAAFFGSFQIFKYLFLNGAKIDRDFFHYAIHGNNPELFDFLEKNDLLRNCYSFTSLLAFAIKCHHNEMANYILKKYLIEIPDNQKEYVTIESIKTYNFSFIQNNVMNLNIFYNLCKYDYAVIVEYLLQNKIDFDINKTLIFNIII
ncbi:hypothetical protein M9Y10_020744 [Tritrichomonas musculus]|uniref:DUF3447 domain-containing protein n=1 Tax=Tritrichomonas musculus TaxID=1915356 RepID=A0ABR2HEJ1_9EUKA